jgi:PIN like domain
MCEFNNIWNLFFGVVSSMRKQFRGYFSYSPEEIDSIWRDAIFAFDANVLLKIYRYTPATQRRMMSVMTGLGARIWIPYQAALEFCRNRYKVISSQISAYEEARKTISGALNALDNQLSSRFGRHSFINYEKISHDLTEAESRILEELDRGKRDHPNLDENDRLLEWLISILDDNKIGTPFEASKQKEHRNEGERRYKLKIPPGFKDDSDGRENPYGDYYIWQQLLERATEKKCSVIFVTDDKKDDWWLRLNGQTKGPRPELVQEMLEVSNQMFHMYTSDKFIEYAEKNLGIQRDNDALLEVKNVREHNESMEVGSSQKAVPGVDPSLVLGVPGRPIAIASSGMSAVLQPLESINSLSQEVDISTSQSLMPIISRIGDSEE